MGTAGRACTARHMLQTRRQGGPYPGLTKPPSPDRTGRAEERQQMHLSLRLQQPGSKPGPLVVHGLHPPAAARPFGPQCGTYTAGTAGQRPQTAGRPRWAPQQAQQVRRAAAAAAAPQRRKKAPLPPRLAPPLPGLLRLLLRLLGLPLLLGPAGMRAAAHVLAVCDLHCNQGATARPSTESVGL